MSLPHGSYTPSEFVAACAGRGVSPEEGRALLARLRARTRLLTEAHAQGMSTTQTAQLLTGQDPSADPRSTDTED